MSDRAFAHAVTGRWGPGSPPWPSSCSPESSSAAPSRPPRPIRVRRAAGHCPVGPRQGPRRAAAGRQGQPRDVVISKGGAVISPTEVAALAEVGAKLTTEFGMSAAASSGSAGAGGAGAGPGAAGGPGAGGPPGAIPSQDGKAVLLAVPLDSALAVDKLAQTVESMRDRLAEQLPDGMTAEVTGVRASSRISPASSRGQHPTARRDRRHRRHPPHRHVPLADPVARAAFVVGSADQMGAQLTKIVSGATGWQISEQTTGIASVLVFGAGTNYALLLIARYREELRRNPDHRAAMRRAVTRAAEPIIGSALTVAVSCSPSAWPSTAASGPSAGPAPSGCSSSRLGPRRPPGGDGPLRSAAVLAVHPAARRPRPDRAGHLEQGRRRCRPAAARHRHRRDPRPGRHGVGPVRRPGGPGARPSSSGSTPSRSAGWRRSRRTSPPGRPRRSRSSSPRRPAPRPLRSLVPCPAWSRRESSTWVRPGPRRRRPHRRRWDLGQRGRGARSGPPWPAYRVRRRRGGDVAALVDQQDAAQRDQRVIAPLILVIVFLIPSGCCGPSSRRSSPSRRSSSATSPRSARHTWRSSACWASRRWTPRCRCSRSFFLVALGVDYNIFIMTRARRRPASSVRPRHRASDRGHRWRHH